jgi:hypothetical protein
MSDFNPTLKNPQPPKPRKPICPRCGHEQEGLYLYAFPLPNPADQRFLIVYQAVCCVNMECRAIFSVYIAGQMEAPSEADITLPGKAGWPGVPPAKH